MSLKETDKVDAIGINKENNVVLSILDDAPWEDLKHHLKLLEDKLNSYISFIECGQLYTAYPDAMDRLPMIQLFTVHKIPGEGKEFLEKAAAIIDKKGILFKLEEHTP